MLPQRRSWWATTFRVVRKLPLLKTAAKVGVYGLLSISTLLAWLYLTYRFTGDPLFPYLSGDPLFPFLKGFFHSDRWEIYNLPVVRLGRTAGDCRSVSPMRSRRSGRCISTRKYFAEALGHSSCSSLRCFSLFSSFIE